MAGTLESDITTKKEDYSDLLALVDMRESVFTSAVRKSGAATNTRFDWTADGFATPDTDGWIDGEDVTSFTDEFANRGKLYNYVQIFQRASRVSTLTQEATDMPGAANPSQAAALKTLKQVKRNMECTFLSSNDAVVGDGTTAYKTCGIGLFISTAGPTVASVPSNQRPGSAQVITTATSSLDEVTDMQGILRAIFDACGPVTEQYLMLCGSVLRARFTEMTRTDTESSAAAVRVRTFQQASDKDMIISSTSVFRGDFGSFRIMPSNWIGFSSGTVDTDRGYLLDMSKVSLRYNKRPEIRKLEDRGGGPPVLVQAIAGLQFDTPKSSGKFQP